MFSKAAIALAAASFAVGAVALTPAMASYDPCDEKNPAKAGCSDDTTARNHSGAEHPTVPGDPSS